MYDLSKRKVHLRSCTASPVEKKRRERVSEWVRRRGKWRGNGQVIAV